MFVYFLCFMFIFYKQLLKDAVKSFHVTFSYCSVSLFMIRHCTLFSIELTLMYRVWLSWFNIYIYIYIYIVFSQYCNSRSHTNASEIHDSQYLLQKKILMQTNNHS